MKPRILVIDDEMQIQRFMKISLAAEGFDYVSALNALDGLRVVREQEPALVILDLGLPDKDGSWLLSQLRTYSQIPVLVLTARDEEDEKVRLLNAGANDYLSKPFGIKELIARIRVLLRDLTVPKTYSPILRCGDIELNTEEHAVWHKNTPVSLTKKEFLLLRYLMSKPNALFTHQQLLHHIWGATHTEDTHYLRIVVSQLRKKLEDDSNAPAYIITEPGIGYRLICCSIKSKASE
ncbi:response regulator transcription factor [Alteromonas sp. C1M14]|uniref:response regulator transcription factor n=1 Tax=Alteromonas sp. C1M14 TaxID=2841567 RepID=UPI001C0A2629|nr:response regulator transcription factor [Alteromonas sp. C1M14]MBU2979535.1 response regulator transcription factor [Alteromonas sp. C1M14]